jgi:hypothetical protein
MNNTDIIVRDSNRKDINRCNCPKCQSRAGTERACFNSRKLELRTAKNALVKAAGLLLLLACFFLQGQATASVTLPAVGPTHPGQNGRVSVSYLTVFSSTQEAQWGEGSHYYPQHRLPRIRFHRQSREVGREPCEQHRRGS